MAGEYAKAAKAVAVQEGTSFLNLWEAMQNEPDWEEMLSDGLHLSRSRTGSTFVYEQLTKLIQRVHSLSSASHHSLY